MDTNPLVQDDVIDPSALLQKAGVDVGMTVADLGVGRNLAFMLTASKMVTSTGVVYALDVVKDVLHLAEERAKAAGAQNVVTVWTDLELYGAAKIVIDGSVDVGLLINTIFQSEQKAAMLKECARMIKPGGKLLIVEWKPVQTAIGPDVGQRVRPEEMKQLADQQGLKVVEEFEAGEYHWGILFQK
jgi:ubiquinone/menaquinone biosynthesis C-methylase UbiE